MSKINLLDGDTVTKINAGQLVDRPVACVKELVENSIDAGATRIEIEIIDGGKSLIRVTDNGVGMTEEDALLSVQSHATSKISSADDLMNISTLGFRGEALPTIAGVSKFSLQTRTESSELGTLIKIEGGKLVDSHSVGCKVGTTIRVENLFFNIPNSLKFLNATSTEYSKVHDFVTRLAISRPDISFKFISGNRNSLTTPAQGNVLDTLTALYGSDLAKSMLPFDVSTNEFKISGYVSKPNFLVARRTRQFVIVNGRVVVENSTIYSAIDEAYKSLVPKKAGYPVVVLKIDVPKDFVDVNVSTQKLEVKFRDNGKIYSHVRYAIRQALSERKTNSDLRQVAATPDKLQFSPMNLDETFGRQNPDDKIIVPNADKPALTVGEMREKLGRNDDVPKDFFEEELEKFDGESNPANQETHETQATDEIFNDENFFEDSKDETPTQSEFEEFAQEDSDSLELLQPIGQVNLCYIVAQTAKDLFLIDQHAAHERILFDKLSSYADEIPAQILLIHQNLEFDSRETTAIENNLELFAKLGFSMELSGENQFRLTSVPADAAKLDAEETLREIISSLPSLETTARVDDERRAEIAANIRQKFIAIASCRGAIKAGQKLSIAEMELLLKKLSQTPHPHTCPHGRPTIIKFSAKDLAKMFKRT